MSTIVTCTSRLCILRLLLQGGESYARRFNGNSTYQCELQHGGPTAHQQLASTVGLRSTISCYDGARRYWRCSNKQVEMHLHAWSPLLVVSLLCYQAVLGFFLLHLLTMFVRCHSLHEGV